MNTKIRAIALLFAAFALSSLSYGQAVMQSTTLSAAVTADSQLVLSVASVTNILAPGVQATQGGIGFGTGANYYLLMIDREVMRVNAVNANASPAQVTVERAVYGTKASLHASGTKVWTGPANYFGMQDPGAGYVEPVANTPCTATTLKVLPKLEPSTGRAWTCGNSLWAAFDPSVPVAEGAVIASATTIAPTNPLQHVSGTTAVATITVPLALPLNGSITIVPDGIFTTTTAGNIAVASTAIVNKPITFTYDSSSSKWVPSY